MKEKWATVFRVSAAILLLLSSARAWAVDSRVLKVGVHENIPARLTLPPGPGPFPGVLLLQTEEGLESGDEDYAVALMRQGYAVLMPDYLGAYNVRAEWIKSAYGSNAQALYGDLCATVAQLRKAPKVGKSVAAVGFSGGYFALWLAATGQVQAGVSYYGDVDGRGSDHALVLFKRVFNENSSPVLILQGDSDDVLDLEPGANLDALLGAVKAPHERVVYKRAEHGFDRQPGYDNWTASKDAWKRTLALLAKALPR